jgi:hypothetical protein
MQLDAIILNIQWMWVASNTSTSVGCITSKWHDPHKLKDGHITITPKGAHNG